MMDVLVLAPKNNQCSKPEDEYFIPQTKEELSELKIWLSALPNGSILLCRGRDFKENSETNGILYTDWEYGYCIVHDKRLILNWEAFKVEIFDIPWCDYKNMIHFVISRATNSGSKEAYQSIFTINKIKNEKENKYDIKSVVRVNDFELFVFSKENHKYGLVKGRMGNERILIEWGGIWQGNNRIEEIKLHQLGRVNRLIYLEIELDKNFTIYFNHKISVSRPLTDFAIESRYSGIDRLEYENEDSEGSSKEPEQQRMDSSKKRTLKKKRRSRLPGSRACRKSFHEGHSSVPSELNIVKDNFQFIKKVGDVLNKFKSGKTYFPNILGI